MRFAILLSLVFCVSIRAATTETVKTLNTLRTFPEITTKASWQKRAKEIREQVLVSNGLWPMPERTPLNTRIFGKVERDGYSIEKVYFESVPGFFVAGNLYRPLGKKGPFPAILNPHGHWANGRMADVADGSIAARCISFARQGMIAFTYDMVGYNDTVQVSHKFAAAPENQLWNISLMGLQTWNSIRALDFLESLKDVDRARLACTGESGGGTQTFILGAIDSRLAVQAPIVMVSHSMQGGCLCENAPGLRINYSNMEISAVPAPRPQILVAASGDWTKATMSVEGPAIESIYRLFNAEERFVYELFKFGHNYNQTSREAVYRFFGKHLARKNPQSLKEEPYKKEPDNDLRVFPNGKLPENAKNEEQLILYFKERTTGMLDFTSAQKRDHYRTAWKRSLQLDLEEDRTNTPVIRGEKLELQLDRSGNGSIPVTVLAAKESPRKPPLVLICHPDGINFLESAEGQNFVNPLRREKIAIAAFDAFLTAATKDEKLLKARNHFSNYFTTYNKTDLQERIQDIATLIGSVRNQTSKVILCGFGEAAVWAVLASPLADGLIAEGTNLTDSEADWLKQDRFFPGVKALGGLDGAIALTTPRPVHLGNSGQEFTLARAAYKSANATSKLKINGGPVTPEAVMAIVKSAR